MKINDIVNESELNEEAGYMVIRRLIAEFNEQMSGSPYYPLDYKSPGMRMWTRGDGARYKDPGYIFIDRDLKPEDQPKWHKAKAVEKFWKFLESKGARKVGDVSGEFGSDPHSPAVVLGKLIFVYNGRSISWGSTSRLKNSAIWRQKQQQGVAEGLNEFAPDGFNGGDDGEEFNPRLAKMAYDEGVVKGVSLADGATLKVAIAINDWDKHDGGIYSQHFAKGFKAGRMNKINHDNKRYNLNLKLMKDGSISHGEQGVAEGLLDAFKPKMKINIEEYDDENMDVWVTLGKEEIARFNFTVIGNDIEADDMSVKPAYRGQGIAKKVYDYLKTKGYNINRSQHQTDAGAHFWDKNKGQGSKVWEQGVEEDSSTTWEVCFDYGPYMSETVKVKASSEEEACAKVEKAAEKRGRDIMVNWVKPYWKREQG